MEKAGLIAATAATLTALAIELAGCAGAPGGPTASALPGLQVVPGSLLLPAVSPAPLLRDTCGAAALASLIGRPRTQIPVATDLSRRRVACTACPVAPDIRLDRVNILFDARTGLVTRITCG